LGEQKVPRRRQNARRARKPGPQAQREQRPEGKKKCFQKWPGPQAQREQRPEGRRNVSKKGPGRMAQKALQVFGEGGLKAHGLLAARVYKPQEAGVEGVAGEVEAEHGLRLQAVFGEAVKIHFVGAIYFVTHQWKPPVFEVHPYLVLPARQRRTPQQAKGGALSLKALQHRDAGGGGAALSGNAHGNAYRRRTFGNRGLYGEVVLRGVSFGDGEVFLVDLGGGEGVRHILAGFEVFAAEQEAAGFPVEAVGGGWGGGIVLGELAHEGIVEVAGRRVYRQAGGFAKDEQVLVFEEVLKGLGAGDGGLLWEGTAKLQAHAGPDVAGGFEGWGELPADEGLYTLAGEAAEFLAQIVVQPPARIVGFDDKAEEVGFFGGFLLICRPLLLPGFTLFAFGPIAECCPICAHRRCYSTCVGYFVPPRESGKPLLKVFWGHAARAFF